MKSIISIGLRVFSALVSLLLYLFIGSVFGSEQAGKIFLFLSAIPVMVAISKIGVDGYLLKEASKGLDIVSQRSSALGIILLNSVILFVLVFLYEKIFIVFELPIVSVFFVSLISTVTAYMHVQVAYVQAYRNYVVANIFAGAIATSISVPLVIVLILDRETIKGTYFLEYYALFCVSSAILLEIILKKREKVLFSNNAASRCNLKYLSGIYYSGNEILGTLAIFLPVMFVSSQLGFASNAMFSMSLKIGMATSLIMQGINIVNAPHFAYFFERKKFDKCRTIYRKVRFQSSLLTVFAAIVVIICTFFASEEFDFSERFSFSVLIVVLLAQTINAVFGPNENFLLMVGHARNVTKNTAIALVVLLFSSWLIIERFGVNGAAVCILIYILIKNITNQYQTNAILNEHS